MCRKKLKEAGLNPASKNIDFRWTKNGISLTNRGIIQEFKKECLSKMREDRLGSTELLGATGTNYNFLGDNREYNSNLSGIKKKKQLKHKESK